MQALACVAHMTSCGISSRYTTGFPVVYLDIPQEACNITDIALAAPLKMRLAMVQYIYFMCVYMRAGRRSLLGRA